MASFASPWKPFYTEKSFIIRNYSQVLAASFIQISSQTVQVCIYKHLFLLFKPEQPSSNKTTRILNSAAHHLTQSAQPESAFLSSPASKDNPHNASPTTIERRTHLSPSPSSSKGLGQQRYRGCCCGVCHHRPYCGDVLSEKQGRKCREGV